MNWSGVRRIVLGHHILAWADQAVVSATSFLALIMIGRWCEPSQLGAYAIGTSALALMLAAQETLITRPYTIQLHRPHRSPAEHAFGSLALSLLLGLAGMLLLGATALALFASGMHWDVVQIALMLAVIVPFILMREFARRFAFAHLKVGQALLLDSTVAAISVVLLGWLGWSGRLSAGAALGAIGLSCAFAALAWLHLARQQFSFRLERVKDTLNQSWALGKWLLSGQLAVQVQAYMTHWLSLMIAGATVTGIYTACLTVVGFANPLLFGFYNILTPRSVRALRAGGNAGLRRQAARDSLLLAGIMSAFFVFVLLAGEQLMAILFPGSVYRGNGDILIALALAALAAAVGVPASIALASAERARAVAAVMIATAALNVVLVAWLLATSGLQGAAYGVLIAELVGSLGRWTAFLNLVPASGAQAASGRTPVFRP